MIITRFIYVCQRPRTRLHSPQLLLPFWSVQSSSPLKISFIQSPAWSPRWVLLNSENFPSFFGVISSLLFVDLILFFCGNISVVNYYQIGVMMKSFDCFMFSLWVLTRTQTFFFFFFSSLLLSSSLALSWVIQLLPSWLCFFSSSKILFGFIIG